MHVTHVCLAAAFASDAASSACGELAPQPIPRRVQLHCLQWSGAAHTPARPAAVPVAVAVQGVRACPAESENAFKSRCHSLVEAPSHSLAVTCLRVPPIDRGRRRAARSLELSRGPPSRGPGLTLYSLL